MDLVVDVQGEAPATYRRRCDGLVAFMSFATVRGFGSQHPLTALADRAHEAHGVPIGPITTFYDATPGDAEDREKLDAAWQPAGRLAAALSALARVITEDRLAGALVSRAGACGLAGDIAWVLGILGPLEAGAAVRLSYAL